MADNLRSQDATKEEKVLGDKATGGLDADADHVPNVESGLRAAISNPNTSTKAKNNAQKKLDVLADTIEDGRDGL